MKIHSTLLATLGGLALSAQALAGEILVDATGRGDARTIQLGIDLSEEGDVILVYPGTYREEVFLVEKGVWIVGLRPDTVVIEGTITVIDLPRLSQAALIGLDVVPYRYTREFAPKPSGLTVQSCEGLVQIDDCSFQGGYGFSWGIPAGPGARFIGAERVQATGTDFLAGPGLRQPDSTGTDGGDGMQLTGSRVACWDCEIAGSQGRDSDATSSTNRLGGRAVAMEASMLFASGSTLLGGDGGSSLQSSTQRDGAPGGDVLAYDEASLLVVQSVQLQPGMGGPGSSGSDGPDGLFIVGLGRYFEFPGAAKTHESGRYAIGQGNLSVTARADAGDRLTMFLTTGAPPFLFDNLPAGAFPTPLSIGSLKTSWRYRDLGVVPSTGTLQTSIPIPAIPTNPAVATATFFALKRGSNATEMLFGAPMPVVGINCSALRTDCDGNGTTDLCEILSNPSLDSDIDGRLDTCVSDCNGNGTADALDIAAGTSDDENGNSVPDECEPGNAAWYVDPAAPFGGDGSLAAPFQRVRQAEEKALGGHEIVLLDGVHRGRSMIDLQFGARGLWIHGLGAAPQCTVDLEGFGGFCRVNQVPVTSAFIVEGIEFRNGHADVTSDGLLSVIEVTASAVEIRGSTFSDCRSPIDLVNCRTLVENCLFERSALNSLRLLQSVQPQTVKNCQFHSNNRSALVLDGIGDMNVVGCDFRINTSSLGAAIYGGGRGLTVIDQCLFAGNAATHGGALELNSDAFLTPSLTLITNSTFVLNRAHGNGGAIRIFNQNNARVHNCIFRDNQAANGRLFNIGSDFEISHSNFTQDPGALKLGPSANYVVGPGVIDTDPMFVAPSGADGHDYTFLDNDYHLLPMSPSADAGDNARLAGDHADLDGDGNTSEPVPFDLDGNPRRVDAAAPNTGSGTGPLVDMGAFEVQ